jgi:hypothetical protein
VPPPRRVKQWWIGSACILLALVASACLTKSDVTSGASSEARLWLPVLIDSVEREGRSMPLTSDSGPLMIEMSSFVNALQRVETSTDSAKVREWIARPFVRVGYDAPAVTCQGDSCEMRDRGILLRLDSVAQTRSGYHAFLILEATDVGWTQGNTATCPFRSDWLVSKHQDRWIATRGQQRTIC